MLLKLLLLWNQKQIVLQSLFWWHKGLSDVLQSLPLALVLLGCAVKKTYALCTVILSWNCWLFIVFLLALIWIVIQVRKVIFSVLLWTYGYFVLFCARIGNKNKICNAKEGEIRAEHIKSNFLLISNLSPWLSRCSL